MLILAYIRIVWCELYYLEHDAADFIYMSDSNDFSAFIRFHFSSALFSCALMYRMYYNKRPYEFADLMELLDLMRLRMSECVCVIVYLCIFCSLSLESACVLFFPSLISPMGSKCTSFCFYIVIEIASGMCKQLLSQGNWVYMCMGMPTGNQM